jgi:hypothetical protein
MAMGHRCLVDRGVGVVAGVPVLIIPSATPGTRRTMAAWCALRHLDAVDGVLQFLLVAILIGHRRFQCLHAHLEQLQWLQFQLEIVQAAHDGIEGVLDSVP